MMRYIRFFKNASKSIQTRERTTLSRAVTKHILGTGHQVDTLQSVSDE